MQDKNLQTQVAALEAEEIAYEEKLKAQKEKVEDYALYWNSDDPALYVGTYGKYSSEAGCFGSWIDLTMCGDYEEFMEVCRTLHADEEDPEFMFQDFQGFPEEWYSEFSFDEKTFNKIMKFAELEDKEAFEAYMKATGDDDFESFSDRYMGKYDSEEDFAEYLANEMYDLERMIGRLAYCIDYEEYARDLFTDGYTFEDGYVFSDY